MNRGVLSGLKSIFIPEWAGGGDPANDGALLGFDSTQPGGVKPVPNGTYVPSGGAFSGLFVAGQSFYYVAPSPTNPSTQILIANNALYAPFPVAKAVTIDRLGIETTVAGTAGAVIRLGIYNDSGNGIPSALLLDAGTVLGTGVGWVEAVIAQTLQPGLYWLAAVGQGAPATQPTVRANAGGVPYGARTSALTTSQNAYAGWYESTAIPGALPASTTPANIVGNAQVGRVGVRVP